MARLKRDRSVPAQPVQLSNDSEWTSTMAGIVRYWPLFACLGGFVVYTVVQLFSIKADIVELRTRLDAHRDWHDGKVPGDDKQQPLPAGSQHMSMTFGPNQTPTSFRVEGQSIVSREQIDQVFKRKLQECGLSDLDVDMHIGGDLGLPHSPQTLVLYPKVKDSLSRDAAACLEQKVHGLGFSGSSVRLYFMWTSPERDSGVSWPSRTSEDGGERD